MTFTADGKRQRLPLTIVTRKVSLTIHSKYKYFDSTVQRAEDKRQKFHFCRLPFAANVMLNLFLLSVTLRQTANGKNETLALRLQLSVQ